MDETSDKINTKIGGYIPESRKEPNECLFENRKICSSPNEINIMKGYLKELDLGTSDISDRKVIEILKEELGVSSESAIWENKQFKEFVGEFKANSILKNNFKPIGPADSTALLDNFNIDDSLSQWSKNGQALFGRNFYHISYQMIDFEKVGSKLSKTRLKDIIDNKYDCFGVVLNTDTSEPDHRGKHWFCLFGDFKHAGTKEDPYTLEYFNSSGNPPMTEVDVWMQKAVHDLLKDTKKVCVIVRATNQQLQYSRSECGVFSLMYIYSRLKGHPIDWFNIVKADDVDMIEMRKHFFRKKY
jgi:hypothetical protein